jgi:hypothetical protein
VILADCLFDNDPIASEPITIETVSVRWSPTHSAISTESRSLMVTATTIPEPSSARPTRTNVPEPVLITITGDVFNSYMWFDEHERRASIAVAASHIFVIVEIYEPTEIEVHGNATASYSSEELLGFYFGSPGRIIFHVRSGFRYAAILPPWTCSRYYVSNRAEERWGSVNFTLGNSQDYCLLYLPSGNVIATGNYDTEAEFDYLYYRGFDPGLSGMPEVSYTGSGLISVSSYDFAAFRWLSDSVIPSGSFLLSLSGSGWSSFSRVWIGSVNESSGVVPLRVSPRPSHTRARTGTRRATLTRSPAATPLSVRISDTDQGSVSFDAECHVVITVTSYPLFMFFPLLSDVSVVVYNANGIESGSLSTGTFAVYFSTALSLGRIILRTTRQTTVRYFAFKSSWTCPYYELSTSPHITWKTSELYGSLGHCLFHVSDGTTRVNGTYDAGSSDGKLYYQYSGSSVVQYYAGTGSLDGWSSDYFTTFCWNS